MTTNDKDTFFSRAQADAELGAQGRFKRETATRVTGVPTYPSQPASSPFAKGLDEVVGPERSLGVDVNAQEPVGTEKEIQASLEPTLKPPEVASPFVEDRVGEPVADVMPSSVTGSSTSMKRVW
jgi:hypothetical protein